MLITFSALNMRTKWGCHLENTKGPFGFVGESFASSLRDNFVYNVKIITAVLYSIIFNPAFLIKEQDHGAF
jgi:hypothetical protein